MLNMKAYREAGEKALAAYGLAGSCRLVLHHRSENVTYLVVSRETENPYAALRVSRPGYHTREETEAELQWLKQIIQENTVTAAKPIQSPDGQSVVSVDAGDVTYRCVLFEYVTGQAPDPEDGDRGLWWFQKTGEAAGKLHLQTMEWQESRSLRRPDWDCGALFGERGLWGNWRSCKELGKEEIALLERVCGRIENRLNAYSRAPHRFGLIHSDLRAANLLVEGSELRVLDFDDCGFGWYLFDLAGSLSFLEDHPRARAFADAWLKGYTAIRKLDAQDYDMIPSLLMARRIQLLAWITSHDDSAPVRTFGEGFAEGTSRAAQQYLYGNYMEYGLYL